MLLGAKHGDKCAPEIVGDFQLGCRYLHLCLLLPAALLQRTTLLFVCGEEQAEAEAAMLLDAVVEVLLEGRNVVGDAGGDM